MKDTKTKFEEKKKWVTIAVCDGCGDHGGLEEYTTFVLNPSVVTKNERTHGGFRTKNHGMSPTLTRRTKKAKLTGKQRVDFCDDCLSKLKEDE